MCLLLGTVRGTDFDRPGNTDKALVIESVLRATLDGRAGLRAPSRVNNGVSPEDGGSDMLSHPKLSHENLDVYRAAIEFLVLVASLLERFPRGHGPVADQLRRAALSIPLNIAEGYGKRGRADRARFYDIARGSAHECGAILDALIILKLVNEPTCGRGKTLLHRIVAMLVKMTA